jgi:hypothetical protein
MKFMISTDIKLTHCPDYWGDIQQRIYKFNMPILLWYGSVEDEIKQISPCPGIFLLFIY